MKTLGFALSVSVLFLAGCVSRPAPRPSDTAPGPEASVPAPKIEVIEELAGTSWLLVELGDSPVEAAPAGWSPQSLEFGEVGLRATGHAGINHFGARYSQEGEELSFGPLAMTRRIGPEALMEAEKRYTEVLSRVKGWRQDGERLILITAGEKRAAVLERVPPTVVK